MSQPVTLDAALAEVGSAEVPDGVDPGLYEELQRELMRVIRETSRSAATPPRGNHNSVDDVSLRGNDADGWNLEWTYRNTGDYNRDGLVNVSDLTPVGQHYGMTQWIYGWSKAQSADGNNDGSVTVSDITPIGQNYDVFVAGYRVYGAVADGADGELVDEIQLPEAPDNGAWVVSYALASRNHDYYYIVPVDGGGVTGQQSQSSVMETEPAQVTLGTDTIQTTQSIGSAGGSLAGQAGSPIEGITVTFPAGALLEDTSIELGYNDGTITPVEGTFVPPIIEIGDGGHGAFLEKVEISIPFDSSLDAIPVLYNIADDGSLEPMQFEEIDFDADIARFSTFHASPKAVITTTAHFEDISQFGKPDTGFRPGRDGMQVRNLGSALYPKGECMGMAAFAGWYYGTGQFRDHGRLFPNYMEWMVGRRTDLHAQDIIATRAQSAILLPFMAFCMSTADQRRNLPDIVNFAIIRAALVETGKPVLVGAYSTEIEMGHSVLAYGLGPSPDTLGDYGINLYIYDPSFPGQNRTIILLKDPLAADWDEAEFNVYDGPGGYNFETFISDGYGSLQLLEPFENILADALQDPPFGGDQDATVRVTSHTQNEEVTDREPRITGHLQLSEHTCDAFGVYAYGDWLQYNGIDTQTLKAQGLMKMDESGDFDLGIKLYPGCNNVRFIIYMVGDVTHGYQVLFDGDVPGANNFDTFNLFIPITPADVAVTSHTSGDLLTGRQATIAGTITSSDINIVGVEMHVNDNEPNLDACYPHSSDYRCEFANWGPEINNSYERETLSEFSFDLPLDHPDLVPGVNQIYFRTYGQQSQIEIGKPPITNEEVDNRYASAPFILMLEDDLEPGYLRFDVMVRACGDHFNKAPSRRPYLNLPYEDDPCISGYYTGSLTQEPYAEWEDLTQYDDYEAKTGHFRMTVSQFQPGLYTVVMSMPKFSSTIEVTSVTVSGIATGCWEMHNGCPAGDERWIGVVYEHPAGTLTLVDACEPISNE